MLLKWISIIIDLVKFGLALMLIIAAILLISVAEWLILRAGQLDLDLTKTMVGRLFVEIRGKVL